LVDACLPALTRPVQQSILQPKMHSEMRWGDSP